MNLKCLLGFHDWVVVNSTFNDDFKRMAFNCPIEEKICLRCKKYVNEFERIKKEEKQLEKKRDKRYKKALESIAEIMER